MSEIDWRSAAVALFNETWTFVALFNEAWTFIDLETRTSADDRDMPAAALGSLACWRKVGDTKNFSISDWQVSRVYAGRVEGAGDRALLDAALADIESFLPGAS